MAEATRDTKSDGVTRARDRQEARQSKGKRWTGVTAPTPQLLLGRWGLLHAPGGTRAGLRGLTPRSPPLEVAACSGSSRSGRDVQVSAEMVGWGVGGRKMQGACVPWEGDEAASGRGVRQWAGLTRPGAGPQGASSLEKRQTLRTFPIQSGKNCVRGTGRLRGGRAASTREAQQPWRLALVCSWGLV